MEEPDTPQAEKHFLDTSVVRPMLVGTRRYKAYFADEFGDNLCYINQYVHLFSSLKRNCDENVDRWNLSGVTCAT